MFPRCEPRRSTPPSSEGKRETCSGARGMDRAPIGGGAGDARGANIAASTHTGGGALHARSAVAAASVTMGGGAADAESAVAPASESDWHERFASVLKANPKKGMKAVMKEIGYSIFCVHGQKRTFCKECGGGGLCEHGRRRSNCKSCGFCEHGLRRRRCKECGGAGISKHGQQRHPPPPHPKHGQQRHPPPPPHRTWRPLQLRCMTSWSIRTWKWTA